MAAVALPKGSLTLTAHKCEDLRDVQSIGKQDPYCKLTAGGESFKTKAHDDGGRNPSWEQAFLFNLDGKTDKLNITVYDKGTMTDEIIARCDLPINALLSNEGKQQRIQLIHPNNFTQTAGYIYLTPVFKGTGGPAKPVAPAPAPAPAPHHQQQPQVVIIQQQQPQQQQPQVIYMQQPAPQPVYQPQQPVYQPQPQPVYQPAPAQPTYQPAPAQPTYQPAPSNMMPVMPMPQMMPVSSSTAGQYKQHSEGIVNVLLAHRKTGLIEFPDNAIFASSQYPAAGMEAYNGRLNGQTAWAPAQAQVGEWLACKLDVRRVITAVVTQGRSNGQCVTEFNVETSQDASTWTHIAKFEAPPNGGVCVHLFPEPRHVQYVRFCPTKWVAWPSMRVDVIITP